MDTHEYTYVHVTRSRSQTGAKCMRAQSTTLASCGADAGNIHRPSTLDSKSADSAHAPTHKRRRAASIFPDPACTNSGQRRCSPSRGSGARPWPGGDCPPARHMRRLSPKCAVRNGAGNTARRAGMHAHLHTLTHTLIHFHIGALAPGALAHLQRRVCSTAYSHIQRTPTASPASPGSRPLLALQSCVFRTAHLAVGPSHARSRALLETSACGAAGSSRGG
jgi:hypothetical protein